ncbi:hypothetical protein llap_15894 [Limosa lapponica baueri]|uniref:Uncharacterized protein n=1 Tax=Limosa lapponica baueri TaxID=1758121 RepID=A0A2I0TJ65_LIMLA|nr:hypothetical protein llap_15894 [Limosa lapponica baueri]
MAQVGSEFVSASVTMEELSVHLALRIGKLEYVFMVDVLQASVLHSRGPSHSGRAILNLLRGPREKAVCSVLASDHRVHLRNVEFTVLT